jgi:hypothetical protein
VHRDAGCCHHEDACCVQSSGSSDRTVFTFPIRAFTISIRAFTMSRSWRSRCGDLRVHDRAKSAPPARRGGRTLPRCRPTARVRGRWRARNDEADAWARPLALCAALPKGWRPPPGAGGQHSPPPRAAPGALACRRARVASQPNRYNLQLPISLPRCTTRTTRSRAHSCAELVER